MTKHTEHTHNGMEDCADYGRCDGCHCHLQDEAHTACCLGSAAREMYEARQVLIERCRQRERCDGCPKR